MTRMWEARAAPGRLDELVAYVLRAAPAGAAVYRSPEGTEPRVVVVDPSGVGVDTVPAELVARPPHSWDFEPVPRTT